VDFPILIILEQFIENYSYCHCS